MRVQQVYLDLDFEVRRALQGIALIGGSPIRLVRLSEAGGRVLDRWLGGSPLGDSASELKLANRLLDSGMVHPRIERAAAMRSYGFVIPVHDDADGLAKTLGALRRSHLVEPVVVVDDASADPDSVRAIASRYDAVVVAHSTNAGPAAARNTGWRHLVAQPSTPEIICFLDADVVPGLGMIDCLDVLFGLDRVAAAAPRVRAMPGSSSIDHYEADCSPLDMGDRRGLVRSQTRISYVPSACISVRVDALREVDGFDEALRTGEDVDFVWRLDQAGHHVRYEPAATAWHRNRSDLSSVVSQRMSYGRAAADLAQRHVGKLAPLSMSGPTIAAWAAALFGGTLGRATAVTVGAVQARRLAQTMDGFVADHAQEALRLSGRSHLQGARWLSHATTRAWLPGAVLAGLTSRRVGRAVIAAFLVPGLVDWWRGERTLDPVRFTALRAVDDVAYCAGVWQGVWKRRSIAVLAPSLRSKKSVKIAQ